MTELIFATTNQYKIKSAQLILKDYDIKVIGTDINIHEIQHPDPEIVLKDKVEKSYQILHKPLIAMDSGLFIEELGGFPGTMTKYVMETIKEDGLIKLMETVKNKNAYVQRTIAYTNGNDIKIFSSRDCGEIINRKIGNNGLGYDLIFYVPSHQKTLAEMSDLEKVLVWGDAWNRLGEWLI